MNYSTLLVGSSLLLGVGCGASEASESLGSVSARLSQELQERLATDDVAGLRFEAERVTCDGEPFETARIVSEGPLSELLLPVENPALAGQPLAPGSEHAFADKLLALAPGCYDITLTPLGPDGEASEGCAAARAAGVRIYPELTTEIVLVSQCQNPTNGLIDTVQAFNHPPQLSPVSYVPSRFVAACQQAKVCVAASDADGDPLELAWTGPDLTPLLALSTTASESGVEQCVGIAAPTAGKFDFTVTAYDLASVDGFGARIEDLLESTPSHARTTFSLVATESSGGCTL